MKKSSVRRVPRKIGGEDDGDMLESSPSIGSAAGTREESEAPSFVKRPANKSRKSTNLRTSLHRLGYREEDETESGVVTPKRSTLSKVAIQRHAGREPASDVPFKSSRDGSEERPSYSASVLDELRQSTPSAPASVPVSDEDVEMGGVAPIKTVDLASKFGTSLSRYQAPSAIPTDAEIQEKKARRARLAKEQDFVSLDAASGDDDDDDLDENVTRDENGKLILKPKDKYPESRIVKDDEDIFENFDEFTSDGKISLGRNADREAAQQRRAEMANLIQEAEGASSDSDDEDESEAERNAAFAEVQTRSGTYASRKEEGADATRPRTPPRITPLPTLDGVVGRLRTRLEEMQIAKANKAGELEALRAERSQIESEEVRVQAALKETAERYAGLRQTLAQKSEALPEQNLQLVQTNGHDPMQDIMKTRSRPGMGLGLGASRQSASDSDSSFEEEDEY